MSLNEITEGLRKAVESGRTDIVRSVISTLQKSTEVKDLQTVLNEACSDDGTLLHLATMLGEADIVRTLLSAGADPGIHNKNQRIPLDLAMSENVRIVFNEELLQATAHSNMGRVCQLLASGLDVNLKDSSESQNTPLHWASCYASRDMVQCLCLRGADVNAVNMDGCTPLHEAVSRGNIEIVEELLIHKADPTLKIKRGDNIGKSALDLADRSAILLSLLQNPPTKHSKKQFQDILTEDFALSESVIQNSVINTAELIDSVTDSPILEYPSVKLPPASSGSKIQELSSQVKELECLPMFSKTVVTEEQLSLLWPRPQSIVQKEGNHFVPDEVLHIYLSTMSDISIHSVAQVWNCRKFMFTSMGITTIINLQSPAYEYNTTCILCHVSSRLCVEKASYKIIIQSFQVKILAHDIQSLSYAIITLSQLFNLYKTESGISIPLLEITDSPSLPYRGVLLDVSKGRVPNIETLKNMLDNIAYMKFNQIHLYTRFRYQTSSAWQLCYSCSELLEIDKFCMDRGMQLIPAVDVHPSVQFEDLPFLQCVFYDYISHFTNSDFINVGSRLTSFLLEYPDDDTLSIADASKFLPIKDKTLLISGSSLHDIKQRLIQRLPPHLMFGEYGTQATYNFVPHCKRLSEYGFGFFVCPGTAAWNSLAGFPEAAVANIFNAAKCASTQSGLGLLVCHWAGSSFLTHSPFCWPGFVITAGLAWNKDIHWEFLQSNLADLMNKHIFRDDSSVFGQVIIELGRIETYVYRCSQKKQDDDQTSLPCENGSTLTNFLVRPDETRLEDLTADILQRANRLLRKHQSDVTSIQLNCPQSKEIISEVLLTTDMMILAVRIGRAMVTAGRNPDPLSGLRIVNLGITNLTATGKTDLANRLLELIENFRVSWKRRYIAKLGLLEATNCLQNVLTQLVPNEDAEKFSSSIIG
ncbi:uncharacterized protein LOC115214018 isoform X1 [Octopus sinensis]|nr:uncharacterized protein LOC115214018 isoform X1 [Octopus sinensis]